MSCCETESACVPLGTGPVLLARVTLNSGQLITEDDLGSIAYSVTRGGAEIDADTIPIGTAVHDTLQTDARWKKDRTGYNFEWDAPYTLFASEGIYLVTVTFTPASGNPVIGKWEVVVSS